MREMASTYSTVRYGSSGQAVRELQKALNREGYSLAVDGGFGEKTRAALLDYQKKKGLTADGVAGEATWSRLRAGGVAETQGAQEQLTELEKGYAPSQETEEARRAWEELAGQKPDDYDSPYAQQLAELWQQLQERQPFSYDPTRDQSFQYYSGLYQRQGQAAMEDAMGQAAGLTGGFASSYAQQTAQQEYDRYMQELMQLLPQLEESQRQRYNQQGQALLEQYQLLQGQDENAYEQWRDRVLDWQSATQDAQERYDALQKQDYSNYLALLKYYADRLKQEQSNALAQQKLAASGSSGSKSSSKSSSSSKGQVLSSVASESLERIIKRHAIQGNPRKAKELFLQYRERLSPTQRKRMEQIMGAYNIPMEQ